MQLFKVVVPVNGHKVAARAHASRWDSLSLRERPAPGPVPGQ